MKIELDIYKLLLNATGEGLFVIYRLDIAARIAEDVLNMRIDFLHDDPTWGRMESVDQLCAAMKVFDLIQHCLKPGKYVCVIKDSAGCEWWARDVKLAVD